jgi:hypothetical protein
VLDCSHLEIVSSNLAGGTDIYPRIRVFVYVGLAMGRSPVQGVLSNIDIQVSFFQY